jgi:hypothetical protein
MYGTKKLMSEVNSALSPTIITEGLAAAAALHFRASVRYIPTLWESMLVNAQTSSL